MRRKRAMRGSRAPRYSWYAKHLGTYTVLGLVTAYLKTLLQTPIVRPGDHVLLVIAHPDDETMFFSPALLALEGLAAKPHVLCLSTGNADGLGPVRVEELAKACQILEVPSSRVRCLDKPDLQDGMQQVWSPEAVQREVQVAVEEWRIGKIITFDRHGVSGHLNHRGVHQGVRQYLAWRQRQGLSDIPAHALVSTGLLRKYLGLLDSLPSVVLGGGKHWLALNLHPWKTWQAMAQHQSQLVWFRYLFITFSRYTYLNSLEPLTPSHQALSGADVSHDVRATD